MARGYLAIVVHAPLPYARHPEYEDALEENWLYEAITETYIPLLLVLESLVQDGIDFRLTLSLSPPLVSMLLDPFPRSRYFERLRRLIDLAESELERTRGQPQFHALVLMCHRRFGAVRDVFLNQYDQSLFQAFQRFQELSKVEILASAATHGYLLLLAVNASAVRAQIRVGIEHYHHIFGRRPKTFWLPECGYYPGLDRLLS